MNSTRATELYRRLIAAQVAEPDCIRIDTTLGGCESVIVDTRDRRWPKVRATWRRDKFEIVASDGTTQSDVMFTSPDVLAAYAFLVGWVSACH